MRWLVAALLVLVATSVVAAERKVPDFAQVCGVDISRPPDGVFATSRKKSWEKFQNVKAVPKIEERSGQMAQYWRGERGSLVQVAGFEHQYPKYHEYCFDAVGKLTRLTFEVKSPAGWGFAETSTVDKQGHPVPVSSRFFGLKSKRTLLERPSDADDFPWALYPKVYKRFDKLPFAKLISAPVEEKREDAQAH